LSRLFFQVEKPEGLSMKIREIEKKKKKTVLLPLFFLCITAVFLSISQSRACIARASDALMVPRTIVSSSPFNATTFWDTEKARVEGTPLNLSVLSQNNTIYQGAEYNRTDMAFDTPNWVGASPATWRVYATLFTPTNESGTLPLTPGVIMIHGTGQRRQTFFNAGLSYAALNCSVLVVDLVGHGASEGPKPTADVTIYQGDFNKSSYHYLAFCNGLQAVRAMLSFTTLVDPARIAITGLSLGGMTSEVVGAIYHDKIALVLPAGIINITCMFPETSVRNLANFTYDELLAVPATLWQYMNPLNYMGIAQYPDICAFMGTTDEYFSYEGIDDVWQVLKASSNQKWLQITSNGHHTYPADQTMHFMLNYKFFSGPAPPTIAITRASNTGGVMEQLQVDATVTCAVPVRSVAICYRYIDVFGEAWRSKEMASNGANQWTETIDSPWITSAADWFVKVTLETGGVVEFTSSVNEAGVLTNYLSFLPLTGIIAAIAIPIFLTLKSRYKVEVLCINEEHRDAAKKHFFAENVLVASTEGVKFGSMAMTWMNYGTIPWSLLYIMQAYFTYEGALNDLAFIFNGILLAAFMAFAVVSSINPLLSGILNLLWSVLFYVLVNTLARSLGTTVSGDVLGTGYYTFMVAGFAQIGIWTWKRIYHKRLAIPTRNLVTIIKSARISPSVKK
jgi:cephalosporin-C deacetylase-like acetyl esterase